MRPGEHRQLRARRSTTLLEAINHRDKFNYPAVCDKTETLACISSAYKTTTTTAAMDGRMRKEVFRGENAIVCWRGLHGGLSSDVRVLTPYSFIGCYYFGDKSPSILIRRLVLIRSK